MEHNTQIGVSRRNLLGGTSGLAAAAAAFTIIKPELVRGAGNEVLKAGVVGCGGRGTQAMLDFLRGTDNTEVVAMADLFEDKLEGSIKRIREMQPTEVDVAKKVKERFKPAPDMRFVGFEAFEKLLKTDIDIVFLATPPGYRPAHFEAAVNAKKHVFCEKPFGTDPVGVRRFMAAAKKSEELKLTVMSGAQRRNQTSYVETIDKIKQGAIGDITSLYAYWVGTPVIQNKTRDPKFGDMAWQHRNWYSYVWICGDQIVEQHLHNIDVCNWVMGTHPVKVFATGGAIWRPKDPNIYGNIYDHVAADFTYANGVKMSSYCRQVPRSQGVAMNVSELIVGTRGRSSGNDMSQAKNRPYEQEHTEMVRSIRGQGPYVNHGMAVAESTMTCIMARESAYSGQEITWEQMMNSQLDLQPKAFGYDNKLEIPGVPIPGEYKFI
jgi:predicted dehydrogenase